jgi:hypothetical protein
MFWCLAWVTLFIYPCLAAAQNAACREELFRSSNRNDPWGYKVRGNRCEGRYIQPSGSYLQVVSLTQFFESYEFGAAKELIVEWNSSLKKPFFIRAFGIKPDLYYRMDTSIPPGENLYRWPSDVLEALQINSDEVGVLGWIEMKIGNTFRHIHIPLIVRQRKAVAGHRSCEVVFQSASRLTEAYYRLKKMDSEGQMIRMIVDGRPLKHGFYPPMQGIKFELGEIPEQSLYLLEITAIQQSGVHSDPVELWFYLGGDPESR